MTLEQWLVFVAVWTLAGLPLGPNALNCIVLSAGAGFGRALWAVLGILVAALCHKAAVILGAAALLLANAEVFFALKLCGAAYLVWMGIGLWRKGGALPLGPREIPPSRLAIVRRALLISLSNPKAVLSYLAVFSQFLTPAQSLAAQLAVLVPTALAVTAAIYIGYCALGSGVGRILGSLRRRLVFNRSIGTAYIAAGTALALADPPGARAQP